MMDRAPLRAARRGAWVTAALVAAVLVATPAFPASSGQAAADRGAALYRSGDLEGARAAFREAVRLDPGLANAWHSLGWVEHRLGDDDEALRIWTRLLRLEPDRTDTRRAVASVEAERRRRAADGPDETGGRGGAPAAARETMGRGDAAYRAGDLPAAEQAYREALAATPGDPRILTKLGWTLRKSGRVEEAIGVWEDAARAGAAPQIDRYLADAHAELGHAEQARALYRRAADAATPSDPGTLFRLAELSLDVGDADDTERSLAALFASPRVDESWASRAADLFLRHRVAERGIALFEGPTVPDGVPGKPRALSRLLAARGAAAYDAGRLDDAAEAYRRAATLDGESRAALRGLGLALRKAGRLDEAEEAWTRYARAFPGVAEPHDLLAALHLDRRAYAEALSEARASLAVEPGSQVAQVRAVRSLVGLTRYREARELAAALAERAPGDAQAQRLYAETLTRSRDFRAATERWRRVLDLQPDFAVAKQNWIHALYESGAVEAALEGARRFARSPDAPAKVLELLAEDGRARGDLDEAARWYHELVRRRPERPEYWRNLLQALDALGRFEEQVAVAREAVARLPARSELQLDLATALGNAGQIDEALARTREFLRAFPDSRAAYEALVDLLGRSRNTAAALAELSRNRPSFYKDYEEKLIEASLRSRRYELASATRLLRGIADAGPAERFVPILLYHGVVTHGPTLQITREAFEEQMAALAAAGYRPITLTQLARMIDGEEAFPERPVLITFDDARTDSFELGDPVLARYGFVASMFVPTAEIGLEDAFHAAWDTMLRYTGTGRWDLQAHGHEAHTPITVSADGDRGEFLAYRRWLPTEQRAETPAEFLERIDRDYLTCQEELAARSGRPAIGYAYPLNQVGYAQREDRDVLTAVNERVAARHYRFGMVQDASGYNHVRPGGPAPFMLRRFEVPGTWSGEALLRHLARTEPRRVARLELARLALDEGRPRAARRALEEILREEPLVAAEVEAALAHVAWQEERPREAAAHLAASVSPAPFTLPRPETLANRLSWTNAPNAGVDSSLFSDSDRRTVLDVGTSLRRPLADQLDLELGVGQLRLAEPGARALSGPQARLGISGAVGHDISISSWARLRQLSGLPVGVNGGLSARLRAEQHALSLRWRYEDVETVPAERAGIRRQHVAAGYTFDSPRWRVEGNVSGFFFEDGNRRSDLHAAVLHAFGEEGRWGIGASVDAADSAFVAPEYWSPERLVSVTSRARYRREWSGSSSLVLELGAGAAHDASHGARPSGAAELAWSRSWGRRRALASALGLEGKALPGYRSLGVTFRVEGRF